jgi:hypothetical protein
VEKSDFSLICTVIQPKEEFLLLEDNRKVGLQKIYIVKNIIKYLDRIIPYILSNISSIFRYESCVFKNSKEKKNCARMHFMRI